MKKLYLYIFFLTISQCFCLKTVRVQLKWYHQFQFAGIYQAIEQGYYRELGLDVEILEINREITSVNQVLASKAEFGVGSIDVLYSYLSGYDLQMISTIYQENALVLATLKKEKFKDVKSFNYSNLMLNAQRFDSLPIYMMLDKIGVNINSIKYIPFDYQKIVSKNLDNVDGFIIYSTDEFRYTKIFKDQINFLRPSDFDIRIYGDVLFTSKIYAENNPKTTLAFKEATLKGWVYALDNSMETIELIKNRYQSKLTKKELFLEYQKTKKLVQNDLVPIGFSNKRIWDQIANSLYDLNLLSHKKRDLEDFYFDYELHTLSYRESLILVFCILFLVFILLQFYKWFRPQIRTKKELENDLLIVKDHLSSIQEFASIGTWSYLISEDQFYFSKGLDFLLKKQRYLANPKLKDFLKYIHEDDKELFQIYFDRLCNSTEGFDLTFRVKRDDGELRDFIINGYVVVLDDDKIVQVQGEVKDITEYIEQEQKLRLTKFSIDDSNELMIWLDLDGKIFDLNHSVCNTFRRDKSSLIGRSLSDVCQSLSYDDLLKDIGTIKDKGELRREIQFDLSTNEKISYEIIGNIVSFKKDQYIFLLLRNITEQKSYENELILAKSKAETEEQLKSNLIATMSHEFHTPINAIVGFSSMLHESDETERSIYIDEIDKSGNRLLKLLDDTLLFSSISGNDFILENFDVKAALKLIINEMQEPIQDLPIQLEYFIGRDVPDLVQLDSRLFLSLLKNLIENAVKYSNEGLVFVELDYSDKAERFSSPFLVLVVKDQGIGIEEIQLDKVFNPFYQVDSSYKRVQAGTGMGLSVCKKITDCVGGTIELQSKLNQGTTITVKYPISSY